MMRIGRSRLSEPIVKGPIASPCPMVTMDSEIASRKTGNAHRMSISRDSTMSTQPPKKPAPMPTRPARTSVTIVALPAMISEFWPP